MTWAKWLLQHGHLPNFFGHELRNGDYAEVSASCVFQHELKACRGRVIACKRFVHKLTICCIVMLCLLCTVGGGTQQSVSWSFETDEMPSHFGTDTEHSMKAA